MPPFKAQEPKEINELISVLNEHTKKGKAFTVRKSEFDVEGTDMKINGWKFNDWDYKKRDLPTEARGLFTYRDPRTGNYEIVTRGYDKFFNINEIHRTKWDWIEEHTQGPYELTVKENGCIIFISGMPGDHLLVCSKHSTGARADTALSHASAGERWVDKQLQKLGKTRADLAKALREANATAVAELCDDSFEEHILAYEEDQAGLYLHGINLNLPKFATYTAQQVHDFADAWGFKKVDFLVKNDVKTLRTFLEEAAETGSWDGRDVEGFVIRSKARYGPNDPEWHDWFFKYKFEEPYLMYRQWREVTKAMINGKSPRIKKHVQITKDYLVFAKEYFRTHPGATKRYQANHGIISLRDAFLAARGVKGSDIIRQEIEQGLEKRQYQQLVLVPIATIGCGKTTVAYALTKLFGWGHIQNDNITAKKGRQQLFAKKIAEQFAETPVVIADRNNSEKRERGQIVQDVSAIEPDTGFVALHYVHGMISERDLRDRIRKVTRERVFKRGDKHQTIRAETSEEKKVIGILENFLDRFQPFDEDSEEDGYYDSCIDLDVIADSRTNLETVVKALHNNYSHLVPEMPTAQELDEAVDAALKEYTPEVTGINRGGSKSQEQKRTEKAAKKEEIRTGKKPSVEYFAASVLNPDDVKEKLNATFKDQPHEVSDFYEKLQISQRVQKAFHVTLMHDAKRKQFPDLWKFYEEKATAAETLDAKLGDASLELTHVVWDERVMAIASTVNPPEWKSSNTIPHITVGTAEPKIKPVESNDMLLKWKRGEPGIQSLEIKGDRIVQAKVAAVVRAAR